MRAAIQGPAGAFLSDFLKRSMGFRKIAETAVPSGRVVNDVMRGTSPEEEMLIIRAVRIPWPLHRFNSPDPPRD